NNVWYYKYAGERFRLINGSWNDDYYYANPHVNDDRLSLGDGSSYPFDKNDGCIIPLTDLNRIKDYRFDIGKGYIHI
ncbi:hypothetical protein KKF82_06550, partial [Patescibacteria group bacterium]|nr:hypothetical protein [Patescibacteria group bacterium]